MLNDVIVDRDLDWWFVEHIGHDVTGYIPKSYIASKGSVEAEELISIIHYRKLMNMFPSISIQLVFQQHIQKGFRTFVAPERQHPRNVPNQRQ